MSSILVVSIYIATNSARSFTFLHTLSSFPCGSAGKESACNAGDLGWIPGLGRSPGEGKGYPLQYAGQENSMGSQRVRHDWVTLTSLRRVTKSQKQGWFPDFWPGWGWVRMVRRETRHGTENGFHSTMWNPRAWAGGVSWWRTVQKTQGEVQPCPHAPQSLRGRHLASLSISLLICEQEYSLSSAHLLELDHESQVKTCNLGIWGNTALYK